MAHKQRTPFTLKSGNKTSFKAMGSSPMQMSFLSPEAAAKHGGRTLLPQNSGINGQATLPQGGISGQAMPTPASKPQTPEMMKARKAREERYLKARAQQGLTTINPQQAQIDLFNQASKAQPTINPQQGLNTTGGSAQAANLTRQHAEAQARAQNQKNSLLEKAVQQGPNTMGGYKGLNQQGPNTIMNAQAPAQANTIMNAQAPAQAAVQSAPRTQAPQAAVQSAPRPDLSGGPRQPMGRPRQPMSGPSQPMGAPRQPMGRPTGGPGQLPPNKGRRRPSTGPGMGRARRATGLARRARRATGLARRVRRSRG